MTSRDSQVVRTRDRDRRSRILAEASHLFRSKGFHAVSIDEIGSAAGISGPGVYRHFGGKDDLLTAVFEQATDDLWPDLDEDGSASVERYTRAHVAYTVSHAEAIELWSREGRNLPPTARASQRRLQRRYVEGWVKALCDARPDLGEEDARVLVQAAIAVIHSVVHTDSPSDAARLAPALERAALAVLRS